MSTYIPKTKYPFSICWWSSMDGPRYLIYRWSNKNKNEVLEYSIDGYNWFKGPSCLVSTSFKHEKMFIGELLDKMGGYPTPAKTLIKNTARHFKYDELQNKEHTQKTD